MITVNLVDDHQIVTDGLKLMLSDEKDIEVQDVAQSGEMAMAQLALRQPDIILLDFSLGGKNGAAYSNGLKTAEAIISKYPEVKIMMLTMHDKAEVIVPCVSAGVHGYMLKSEKNANFGSAIRQLYEYSYYFSPEIAKDLAITLRNHNQDSITLSQREQEVLECLFEGCNTKEIGERLFISHHTVESHRKNLISKFEARNSVHLIYLALKKGHLKV